MTRATQDHAELRTIASSFSVNATIDRLSTVAQNAGLIVFSRIDHGANAAQLGIPLRPTELALIGHPRGGTPLMLDQQTAGIDLPVRVLGWEDESGQVWLTYTKPEWIARRHQLSAASRTHVDAISSGLAALAAAAMSDAGSG
jgi:uncharacterized protein (DUF302 family)